MELVEFLRARLDEDEFSAKAAAAHNLGDDESVWIARKWGEGIGAVVAKGELTVADTPNRGDFGGLGWYAADHIARHDPARVLADVEAKRRIVELAVDEMSGDYYGQWRDDLLRLLALPYADHDGYRGETATVMVEYQLHHGLYYVERDNDTVHELTSELWRDTEMSQLEWAILKAMLGYVLMIAEYKAQRGSED